MPVTRSAARAQEWATASTKSTINNMSSCSSIVIEDDAASTVDYKTATEESLTALVNDAEEEVNSDSLKANDDTRNELSKIRTEIAELSKIVQQLVSEKNTATETLESIAYVVSESCSKASLSTIANSDSIPDAEIEKRIEQLRGNVRPELFNGRDHPLSNCYEHSWCSKLCKIHYMGKSFKTAENAWAWLFLTNHGLPEEAKLAAASDPFAAKSQCKKVRASSKWNKERVNHMIALQNAKLECCDGFRTYLLESKGTLIENTRDPFWGGIPMYNGENTLGQILMELRSGENKAASRTFISNERAAPVPEIMAPHHHEAPSTVTAPASSPKFNRNCYKCGERNHTTNTCRHESRIKCNLCNQSGHKSKMCNGRPNIHNTNMHIRQTAWQNEDTTKQPQTKEGYRSSRNGGLSHPYQRPVNDSYQHQRDNQNGWSSPINVMNTPNKASEWPAIGKGTPPYPIDESYNMYSVLDQRLGPSTFGLHPIPNHYNHVSNSNYVSHNRA